MRLKLDENLPHDLADELTRRGHDVDTVLDEQLGGRKDPVVVQAATEPYTLSKADSRSLEKKSPSTFSP